MTTVKFATKHFVIYPTKNPDFFTVRAVDLSECRHFAAVVPQRVSAVLATHKGETIGFTYSYGKDDNGEFKTYLNRLDCEGGVIYDSYAEYKNKTA